MNCVTVLLCALGISGPTPPAEPGELALSIVQAVLVDAGFETNSKRRRPIVDGPIVIDDVSFRSAFDNAFGEPAGREALNAVNGKGYSFGDIRQLQAVEKGADGAERRSLRGDALLIRLVFLLNNGENATAMVRYYYTYKGQICPRMLRLEFKRNSGVWELQESALQSQC